MTAETGTPVPHLTLRFHGDLKDLVRGAESRSAAVQYPLTRTASIKDIIESLGIPHTEVGSISGADGDIDFAAIPQPGERLEILPITGESLPIEPSVLRPAPLSSYRFLVDINAARLAALLRMAGFDTASVQELRLGTKQEIADAAGREALILLSRDRDLLKLRSVVHGRLLREQHPYRQLAEIVDLYRLAPLARPFTRCMKCNHLLAPVAKAAIIDRLEPLTKKYYDDFSCCSSCASIYWRGSHYRKMIDILKAGAIDDSVFS